MEGRPTKMMRVTRRNFGVGTRKELTPEQVAESDPNKTVPTMSIREQLRRVARLPNQSHPCTFQNFRISRDGNAAALAAARAFAQPDSPFPILTICGPNGNGKSHLLEAIGRVLVDRGEVVYYRTAVEILDELKATFDKHGDGPTTESLFESFKDKGTLLLDDLGAIYPTAYGLERLEAIINHRYAYRRPMAVTVDRQPDEITRLFKGRSAVADRLWDRHSGKVRAVTNSAPSYRRTGRVA